jgi:hypothetical protein
MKKVRVAEKSPKRRRRDVEKSQPHMGNAYCFYNEGADNQDPSKAGSARSDTQTADEN